MTLDTINSTIHEYSEIVLNMPLSKQWNHHIIRGFSVQQTAIDKYELLVLAENPTHLYPFMSKHLMDWLKDNHLEGL
jgi:hypothetical protein